MTGGIEVLIMWVTSMRCTQKISTTCGSACIKAWYKVHGTKTSYEVWAYLWPSRSDFLVSSTTHDYYNNSTATWQQPLQERTQQWQPSPPPPPPKTWKAVWTKTGSNNVRCIIWAHSEFFFLFFPLYYLILTNVLFIYRFYFTTYMKGRVLEGPEQLKQAQMMPDMLFWA